MSVSHMLLEKMLVYFLLASSVSLSFASSCSKTWADNIESKINETLIEISANIGEIKPDKAVNIASGKQEFGLFNVTLDRGTIYGFGNFVAETIEFQVLPPALKNLTLHFYNITFDFAQYDLQGFIQFPLGDQRFDLFGSGAFRTTISDLIMSVGLKISLNGTKIVVKDLVLYPNVGNVELHMENLMGGEDVGWAFETVLNDVVVTIFDYYKCDIVDAYRSTIEDAVNNMIDKILHPDSTATTELRNFFELLRSNTCNFNKGGEWWR